MTIDEMRALLGLGPEVSDEDVAAAYALYLEGEAPPAPLITLEDAKRQVRLELDDTDDDVLLADLIGRAIAWVEDFTGQSLSPREIVEQHPDLAHLALDAWPVRAVDKIEYLDPAGARVTLDPASYRVAALVRPVQVHPAGASGWPATLRASDAVTVTMQAGYDDPARVDTMLRSAALLILSGLYKDREDGGISEGAVKAAQMLCNSFRRWAI